jgi:hypothetical protein
MEKLVIRHVSSAMSPQFQPAIHINMSSLVFEFASAQGVKEAVVNPSGPRARSQCVAR